MRLISDMTMLIKISHKNVNECFRQCFVLSFFVKKCFDDFGVHDDDLMNKLNRNIHIACAVHAQWNRFSM